MRDLRASKSVLRSRLVTGMVALATVAGSVAVTSTPVHASAATTRLVSDISVSFSAIAGGLNSPTAVTSAPGRGGRLFVAEQRGTIRVVRQGHVQAKPYLDIRNRVQFGGERGLLGLAFSPDFTRNRLLFVTYTDKGGSVVLARAKAKTVKAKSIPAKSVRTLFRLSHPTYSNHNGGSLTFTTTGLLVMGVGDGGSGGDPRRNAQRLTSPLGKLLRINVDKRCGKQLFCIPSQNPYRKSKNKIKRMVWADGLRNPWRISTDTATGKIWIADVGQDRYEEINVVGENRKAPDFGWSCREGFATYNADQCGKARNAIAPVAILCHTYPQAGCAGKGQSIIGGYVYRGNPAKAAYGAYLFGDFLADGIYAYRDGQTARIGTQASLTSFGQTQSRELVAVSYSGTLYALNLN